MKTVELQVDMVIGELEAVIRSLALGEAKPALNRINDAANALMSGAGMMLATIITGKTAPAPLAASADVAAAERLLFAGWQKATPAATNRTARIEQAREYDFEPCNTERSVRCVHCGRIYSTASLYWIRRHFEEKHGGQPADN